MRFWGLRCRVYCLGLRVPGVKKLGLFMDQGLGWKFKLSSLGY